MKTKSDPAPSTPKAAGYFHCAMLSALTLCFATSALNGQPLMLRDINTRGDVEQNEYRSLTPGHGTLYFVNNFNELWKTTGNVGGTVRLKAFHSLGNFKHIGQTLYFAADDGSGMELWKCTGTYASIEKVKEIIPGTSGGNPAFITEANGIFYFTASTSDHGNELWRSDGTSAGTHLVKDIQPGKRGSDPKGLTFINGELYFSANDGKTGHELWRSDGTSSGTVLLKDIRQGAYLGSTPEQLTNVNGTLFFVAFEPVGGKELWKSDGTPGGTVLAADIRVGAGSPDVRNLTAVNNTLFFSANDGVHGHELWKSDGVETMLVKDLTPGGKGSHGQQVFTHPMTNFTSVFGSLFFTAYLNDIYYIWKSDGTATGTIPIEIARNGINTPAPRFVPMGSSIFYLNSPDDIDNIYETHLIKMRADGTGSVVIARLFQEDFYTRYEPELVTMNNSLYFWGRREAEGFALFRSNGTPGSMILLNDSFRPTQSSHPANMTSTDNGHVFFIAEEESYTSSVWRTDGTPEGTIKIQDLGMWGTPEIVTSGSHAYFAGLDGLSIWKSDGTPDGTNLIFADYSGLPAQNLRIAGGLLYFAEAHGGLWRSNGTEEGTFPLKQGVGVRFAEPVGDILYFMIETDYNYHSELWATNGSPSGTYRIYSFSGNRTSYYNPTTVDGNIMYFIADDGIYGNEVWRTDGTTAGTFRIADLHAVDNHLSAGVYEVDIAHFEMWRGDLYISALDNTNTWALYKYNDSGMTRIKDLNMASDMIPTDNRLHIFSRISNEVYATSNHWVTDGTASGTELINAEYYYGSVNHVIYEGILYFNAYNMFFWRSDGTPCGTFMIDPGIHSTNAFQNIGNLMVFGGISPTYGIEPFVIDLNDAPESPCGEPTFPGPTVVSDNNDAPAYTSYPNPFTQEFVVTIPGTQSDRIDIQILTPSGLPLETLRNISANTEYRLGASWRPGHYLMKINKSGLIQTRQVVKK